MRTIPHFFRVILSLILLLILSSCTRDLAAVQSESTEKTTEEPVDRVSVHPKSIEGLSNRNFSLQGFEILDEIPARNGLSAQEFRYESDGFTIYGLIEKPDGKPPVQGWPVIVLAHGYIPTDAYSTSQSYRLVTQYYAGGGFLVIKPDYRNHGRSEGEKNSATRTIDYTIDVMNLIAGLNQIPGADTDNVFLYGHSMGGEIGLRILEISNALKGATLWAGVTEAFPENTLYFVRKRSNQEALELKTLIESEISPEFYPSLSPINYLDRIQVPVYVHHGTADESVPYEWSIPFRSRLDEAGVDYQFYEYPGENHNISKSFYRVMDKDMEFFRSLTVPNPD